MFAPQAMTVVSATLKTKDPMLIEEACEIFEAFNKYHDGIMFTGDASFVRLYLEVVRQFNELALAPGPQSRILVLISLAAISSLTASPAIKTSVGQKTLSLVIPVIYRIIRVDDEGGMFARFDKELSMVERRARSSLDGRLTTDTTLDTAHVRALAALHNTYDTNHTDQVANATVELLRCIVNDRKSSLKWQKCLLITAARWAQVQIHFVVFKIVAKSLYNLPLNDLETQMLYCELLESLLGSNISLVGLSVVDVLRQLLECQHRLIVYTQWTEDQEKLVLDVLGSLRCCIAMISQRRIYPGQVPDMLSEILSRYSDTPDDSPNSDQSIEIPCGIFINDLQDIRAIIKVVPDADKLPMGLFMSTQWICTLDDPQAVVFYTLAVSECLRKSRPLPQPYTRQNLIIVREFFQIVLVPSNRSENYIALYHLLLQWVEHLGQSAAALFSWLIGLQHFGSAAEQGDQASHLSARQGTEIISLCQGLMIAIATQLGRQDSKAAISKIIDSRVKGQQWLAGISYPPVTYVDKAIAACVIQIPHIAAPPTADEPKLVSIDDLELTATERNWVTHPQLKLTEPVLPEDLIIYKTRMRTTAETISSPMALDQRVVSSRSFLSLESDAPKVADLKRRANVNNGDFTPVFMTRRTSHSSSNDTKKESRLVDVLADLKLETRTCRGKITA